MTKTTTPNVSLIDEPFHKMRNRIIRDLKGTWTSSVYWQNFRDKELLRAVITRMQSKGDLVCRYSDIDSYEWTVPPTVEPTKLSVYENLR